jgi:hypothetical protein
MVCNAKVNTIREKKQRKEGEKMRNKKMEKKGGEGDLLVGMTPFVNLISKSYPKA